MQLVIINIKRNGSDVALILNGEIIITADPQCGDDSSSVLRVASNLSRVLKVANVIELNYEPEDGWEWDDVVFKLKAEGKIVSL